MPCNIHQLLYYDNFLKCKWRCRVFFKFLLGNLTFAQIHVTCITRHSCNNQQTIIACFLYITCSFGLLFSWPWKTRRYIKLLQTSKMVCAVHSSESYNVFRSNDFCDKFLYIRYKSIGFDCFMAVLHRKSRKQNAITHFRGCRKTVKNGCLVDHG